MKLDAQLGAPKPHGFPPPPITRQTFQFFNFLAPKINSFLSSRLTPPWLHFYKLTRNVTLRHLHKIFKLMSNFLIRHQLDKQFSQLSN